MSLVEDADFINRRREEKANLTPPDIAQNYKVQIVETTRRTLALRKRFPGAMVKFKRAATSGKNYDWAVILIKHKGKPPMVIECLYKNIDDLAASVTDEEVFAELDRRAEWYRETDI